MPDARARRLGCLRKNAAAERYNALTRTLPVGDRKIPILELGCLFGFLKYVTCGSEGGHFSVLHGFEFGADGILKVLSVAPYLEEGSATFRERLKSAHGGLARRLLYTKSPAVAAVPSVPQEPWVHRNVPAAGNGEARGVTASALPLLRLSPPSPEPTAHTAQGSKRTDLPHVLSRPQLATRKQLPRGWSSLSGGPEKWAPGLNGGSQAGRKVRSDAEEARRRGRDIRHEGRRTDTATRSGQRLS